MFKKLIEENPVSSSLTGFKIELLNGLEPLTC